MRTMVAAVGASSRSGGRDAFVTPARRLDKAPPGRSSRRVISMKGKRPKWALCTIALFMPLIATAQDFSIPAMGSGPPGGNIRAIAINPEVPAMMYAATDFGLYRTTDGGGVWRPTTIRTEVLAVALRPGGPSVIYAGATGSIHRSDDWGASWSVVARIGARFSSIVIDPRNPSLMYAATIGDTGVFRSMDAGASWQLASAGLSSHPGGLPLASVHSLVVDVSGVVFAASSTGIFKSTDRGSSWVRSDDGLTSRVIAAVVVHPADRATVLAAAYGEGGGIFKSSDGGARWTAVLPRLPGDDFVALSAYDDAIYAATTGGRLYTSVDRGDTWHAVDTAVGPSAGINTVVRSGRDLYIGTMGTGVFRVVDQTWIPLSFGLPVADVRTLALTGSDRKTLIVGSWGSGIHRSIDDGYTWAPSGEGLTTGSIVVLTADVDDPSVLYAGAANRDIFRSVDEGRTWSATTRLPADDHNPGESPIIQLLTGPSNSGILFAVTPHRRFRSTDAGGAWTEIDFGIPVQTAWLTIDPRDRRVVYASTGRNGLLRSEDSGETWTVVNSELPTAYVLGIDPSNTSVLYAFAETPARFTTIYRSADRGASWTQLTEPRAAPQEVGAITVDPSDSSTLYITGDYLYKSINGGQTWVTLSLPTYYPQTLVFDPANSSTLYAVAWGVFKSTDAGATWRPAGERWKAE
jgi:photosystem II stability/assembly factor-like uncharacterized protein